MPDLDFQVTGVETAAKGLTPLLHFKVAVRNAVETETIHTVMLHAQIQLQCPLRSYNAEEKEKLVELFGAPERWGQTLRNRLLGSCDAMVRTFTGRTDAILALPCSFDLNLASAKYFHALEGGEVPLLFLFSGSIFYAGPNGQLQVQQISWKKECVYRMPVQLWQEMMDEHFPNSAWLYLQRDVFDQLCAYRRRQGFNTWEQTIAWLLASEEKSELTV